MVDSGTISKISKQELDDLLREILSSNLHDSSKPILKEILETFSNLLADVKSKNISIAKLRSMLGFYSEKQKK